MIKTERTDSANSDFQNLVSLLDAELKIRDGDDHSFYAQFNYIDTIKHVLVLYEDKKPVACGAFKKYDKQIAEIKRMFVLKDHRGRGLAQQVLLELEKWAAELENLSCVLETGINQPEAIRLYEKTGYSRIPNYGQYQNVKTSICMKKDFKSI